MITALRIPALVATAVALTAASAAAQPGDSTRAKPIVGAAQTSVGYAWLGAAGLNAQLRGAGLATMSTGAATVGISADMRFRHFLVAGGWQSIVPATVSNSSYRTRVTGDIASLDVGAFVLRGSRGALFVLAGAGARNLGIRVERRGPVSFDDALLNPGRGMDLTGTSLLTHAGVGGEWRPLSRFEATLSVRAGLVRGASPQEWMGAFDDVAGGPDNVRGSYVSIGLSSPLRSRRNAVLPMVGTLLRMARS